MTKSTPQKIGSPDDASLAEWDNIEQPNIWQSALLEGESIASYLYRLRLQNAVSAPSSLSESLGLGIALNRWEKFRFNPFPTEEELALLGDFCGETVERLMESLPPEHERKRFMFDTLRLCAACCVEVPYHRLKWQFNSVEGCDRHKIRLLSRCPGCKKKFAIVSKLWTQGKCECGMLLTRMVKYQAKY